MMPIELTIPTSAGVPPNAIMYRLKYGYTMLVEKLQRILHMTRTLVFPVRNQSGDLDIH